MIGVLVPDARTHDAIGKRSRPLTCGSSELWSGGPVGTDWTCSRSVWIRAFWRALCRSFDLPVWVWTLVFAAAPFISQLPKLQDVFGAEGAHGRCSRRFRRCMLVQKEPDANHRRWNMNVRVRMGFFNDRHGSGSCPRLPGLMHICCQFWCTFCAALIFAESAAEVWYSQHIRLLFICSSGFSLRFMENNTYRLHRWLSPLLKPTLTRLLRHSEEIPSVFIKPHFNVFSYVLTM